MPLLGVCGRHVPLVTLCLLCSIILRERVGGKGESQVISMHINERGPWLPLLTLRSLLLILLALEESNTGTIGNTAAL